MSLNTMEERNKQYINLLRTFEGKSVLILTKQGFRYKTSSVSINDDFISFLDKFGEQVFLSLSEIASITEDRVGGSK